MSVIIARFWFLDLVSIEKRRVSPSANATTPIWVCWLACYVVDHTVSDAVCGFSSGKLA